MRFVLALLATAGLLLPQIIIVTKKKVSGGSNVIGYNTIGSDTPGWNNALAVVTKFTAPASGANGTFSVYCVSTTASAVPVAVGVYAVSGGNVGALLTAGTETVNCPGSGTGPAWVSTSITWSGITAATDYWLATQTTTATNVTFYRDIGTTGQEQYDLTTWSGSLPNPWTLTPGINAYKVSVYVTY